MYYPSKLKLLAFDAAFAAITGLAVGFNSKDNLVNSEFKALHNVYLTKWTSFEIRTEQQLIKQHKKPYKVKRNLVRSSWRS